MAEALSRLHNPRRPEAEKAEPKGVDTGTGDPHHDAAENLHQAEPESKHMIVSHDGMSYHSHGVHEDGRHEPEQGAHDHENMEALKSHMNQFFNEEEDEGKPNGDGEEPEEDQSIY